LMIYYHVSSSLHTSITRKWFPSLNRLAVSRYRVVKIARSPAAAGWTDNISHAGFGTAQIVLGPAFATLIMHDFFRRDLFAFWALDHRHVLSTAFHEASELVLAMRALVIVSSGRTSRARLQLINQNSHSDRSQYCRRD
jgi:hypothetical protein